MKNDLDHTYIGLDVGSSQISAVLCTFKKTGHICIQNYSSCSFSILEPENIYESETLKNYIHKVLNDLQLPKTISPTKTFITTLNSSVSSIENQSSLYNNHTIQTLSYLDVQKAIQQSIGTIPPQKKLIYSIPSYYTINSNAIKNPIGLPYSIFTVYTQSILTDSTYIHYIQESLKNFPITINELIPSPITYAESSIRKDQLDQNILIIDIGVHSTHIGLFKHSLCSLSLKIPIGSHTITKDISTCLLIPILEAERIKIHYGTLDLSKINPDQILPIKLKNGPPIKIELLAKIIDARITELWTLIKKNIASHPEIVDLILLAGKGSLLSNIDHHCRLSFNIQTSLATTNSHYPFEQKAYLSALGSILYGTRIRHCSKTKKRLSSRVFTWIKKQFL